MGRLAILMVAVMVVLAGCSTGGGGGDGTPETTETTDMSGDMTPTPDSSDDSMDDGSDSDSDESDDSMDDGSDDTMDDGSDDTMDDGSDDSMDDGSDDSMDDGTDDSMDDGTETNVSDALENLNLSSSGSGDLFSNATTVDLTLYNGSETTTLTTRNDTSANRSILTLDRPAAETTYYETADYVALRNATSGEIRYGEPGSGVGFGVSFASAFILFGSLSYIGFVEWEPAGQTTINGQTAAVFEGDSLNRSAFDPNDNREEAFGPDQVESVDGRMVIGQDGRFYSLDVEIIASGQTFGTDLSIGYDSVTVDKPDWVDESQAPN